MDQKRFNEFMKQEELYKQQQEQYAMNQDKIFEIQKMNYAISNLPFTTSCPGAPLLTHKTLVLK